MGVSNTERRAFLWRLSVTLKPSEAEEHASVSLDDVIGILEAEWTAKRARVFLAKGSTRIVPEDDPKVDLKNQIYIADIRRDPASQTVTLLINRGDPDTLSPAFIDIKTTNAAGSVRVEHPREPETPGWSAHLVISMKGAGPRYRACFEQMPRVSSSLVETALERMIEAAVAANPSFSFDVITKVKGKPKVERKRYRPVLSAARVPSENLLEDLDQGQLTGVTITKRLKQYAGVGENDVIRYQEEKIVFHTRPADKSKTVAVLGNLINQAKADGYEKVSFHLDKLPGNATNQPTLSLTDQDALEHLYVRAQRLHEFGTILVSCYPFIHSEIADKMISLVNDDNNW